MKPKLLNKLNARGVHLLCVCMHAHHIRHPIPSYLHILWMLFMLRIHPFQSPHPSPECAELVSTIRGGGVTTAAGMIAIICDPYV